MTAAENHDQLKTLPMQGSQISGFNSVSWCGKQMFRHLLGVSLCGTEMSLW